MSGRPQKWLLSTVDRIFKCLMEGFRQSLLERSSPHPSMAGPVALQAHSHVLLFLFLSLLPQTSQPSPCLVFCLLSFMSLMIGKFQVIEPGTTHPMWEMLSWILWGIQDVQTNAGQRCEEPAHTNYTDAQTHIQLHPSRTGLEVGLSVHRDQHFFECMCQGERFSPTLKSSLQLFSLLEWL